MDTNKGKGSRPHEMIAGRGRRLLGFGGLDERVLVGLGADAGGKRRGTDRGVGLGAAPDVAGAIRLAETGPARHPGGTVAPRRNRDRLGRPLAAQRLEREADARQRALIAASPGVAPVSGDPVAIAAE